MNAVPRREVARPGTQIPSPTQGAAATASAALPTPAAAQPNQETKGAGLEKRGDELATDEPALLVPLAPAGFSLVSLDNVALDTIKGLRIPNIKAKIGQSLFDWPPWCLVAANTMQPRQIQ